MAFDVSKIATAVNKYLYSISDVNKLVSEDTGSDLPGISGIFQKYLNGALNNIDASKLDTESRQAIIDAMKVSDSMSLYGMNGSKDDTSALDALGSLSDLSSLGNISSLNQSGTLGELGVLSELLKAGLTDSEAKESLDKAASEVKASENQSTSGSSDVDQAFKEVSAAHSRNLNLEDEIKGAFAGMDNLAEQIQARIANRDITGEVNKSVANLDIQGDIIRSIANHDRSDEINEYNSYNASRIASYKNVTSGTSVFGDFKL